MSTESTESTENTDVDLAEVYSWPESGRWLRATMLQTLDGAYFGPDHRSKSLSSKKDTAVLIEGRRLADAILIGAETMRQERYRPLVAKPEWQQARSDAGLAPAPVLVMVSNSLDLPWEEDLFGQSAITPIVLTAGNATADMKARAQEVQEQGRVEIIERNDLPTGALEFLWERGYNRIDCEGGPTLLAELMSHVDELDLTVAPFVVGTNPGTLPDREPELIHWTLDAWWTHEDYVFTKYLRNKN